MIYLQYSDLLSLKMTVSQTISLLSIFLSKFTMNKQTNTETTNKSQRQHWTTCNKPKIVRKNQLLANTQNINSTSNITSLENLCKSKIYMQNFNYYYPNTLYNSGHKIIPPMSGCKLKCSTRNSQFRSNFPQKQNKTKINSKKYIGIMNKLYTFDLFIE